MFLAGLKAYAAIIAAGLLAVLLGVQTVRLHSAQLDAATTKTQHAQTLQAIADLTAKAERAARATEDQWATTQEKTANETAKKLAASAAHAATARATADRLQLRVKALSAAARTPAESPGAEATEPPTSDPLGMFADVLLRADARAGVLAEYADRAHIAGAACEADYDALRRKAPE